MEIIEKKVIDKIEILENNFIQVRTAYIIEKNGIELTRTFQRKVLVPTDNINIEDVKVQSVANSIWTLEVIQSYKDFLIEKQKDEFLINKI